MNPKTRRFVAGILIGAAILGWLISLTGFVAVWAVRPRVTTLMVNNVKVVKGTLQVTLTGLDITLKSLSAISSSMETLQSAVQTTADTVAGTTPFLDSLITITDDNLVETVGGLKNSLATAQEGAKVIDDALRKITNLPLIGPFLSERGYDPGTPLDEGLSKVADGIDNLDGTFLAISQSLSNTRDNIETVQSEIGEMAQDIGEIKDNLREAESVLAQYQESAQRALDFLNRWEEQLPELITLLAVIFSLLFIWIAATQLGLFLQGREHWRSE